MPLECDEKKSLDHLSPVYFPNEINIVDELFIPVSKASSSFDCLSGYFSSKVLSELAEPLAYLLQNPNSMGRFVISQNLSKEDKDALLDAYTRNEPIFNHLIDSDNLSKDTLAHCTLEVMKYLIISNRLDIRIALMKNGMMHAKIWLFKTKFGTIAIHGSGNATKQGLITNFERLVYSSSWESNNAKKIIDSFKNRFNTFWFGLREDTYTLNLNDKTIAKIIHSTDVSTQTESFQELVNKIKKHLENKMSNQRLTIPTWLNYRDGDYSHQGEAIDSWLENDKKGILSIATGGGKTLTSLAAISLALSNEEKSLIVITVPTKPLISQWGKDVKKFSLIPLETAGFPTKTIIKELKTIRRQLRTSLDHKVIILTHSALKNHEISNELEQISCLKVLIADEAHNLGSEGFISNLPNYYKYRIALSATIDRQYDEQGTSELKSFFGGVVYEYPIEKAIGKCLVPFSYFVHKIYLNQSEVEQWIELSKKIRKLYGYGDQESISKAELLAIRRRSISESASEKISMFHNLLKAQRNKDHTLIFCTDKDKEQLIDINRVLRVENVRYRQITSEETRDEQLTKRIIDDFSKKHLQVLTSKRVLDEGFNIPQIKTAYIISSNGVERQWLQRLGRVLRKSDEAGKKEATIHDFVVIPPLVTLDSSLRTLINNELKRVLRFSELSKNTAGKNGSLKLIKELTDLLE
ncbi:MAG: DEAD/DEAH box helicase family protein [Plesiomonas shigelloides]